MEKTTGIIRKVDELGRVVLPAELRRALDIRDRDTVEIFVDGPSIVLRKNQPVCIFCEEIREIVPFREKYICRKCLLELSQKLQEF